MRAAEWNDEAEPYLLDRRVCAPDLRLAPEGFAGGADTHHRPSRTTLRLSRLGDFAFALVCIVAVLPLGLLIALAVKCTSRGPVFFRQLRVGRDGKLFGVYKFRTMRHGAHGEVMDDELLRHRYRANDFKLPVDDPRITTVGRLLRKTSADEIPQLINVLLGHMSVVGVRPLLEEELALRPARDQELYKQFRPGMTGMWQVEGRSTVCGVDRHALDLRYLETWSIRSNALLLIRTPLAVLRGLGAQ